MMARHAFVFGSNGAPHRNPLRYALHDVDIMRSCLESGRCGFEVTTPPQPCDKHEMLALFEHVIDACHTEDDLVVYFSGHGDLVKGELFLLWGATSTTLLAGAIPAANLMLAFRHCAARNRLLILDCCHAGGATGFKDGLGPALEPILSATQTTELGRGSTSRSHLVLAASERLELAREIDEYQASFMAHGIRSILASPHLGPITIEQLGKKLRLLAECYNSTRDATLHVPLPYLFGEMAGDFLLTNETSPGVVVRFRMPFEPDTWSIRQTVQKYSNWNSTNLRNELPVAISLPAELQERIDELKLRYESNDWPAGEIISDAAKDQARELYATVLPHFVEELTHGVRDVLACSSDELENINAAIGEAERDEMLELYLAGRVFALLRLLLALRYHGETAKPWMSRFFDLDTVWNTSLINGLPYVLKSTRQLSALYWYDADLRLPHTERSCRVYLPKLEMELSTSGKPDGLPTDVAVRCLAPQLVRESKDAPIHLRDFFSGLRNNELRITDRHESFIDVATFNSTINSYGVRRSIVTRVESFISDQLRSPSGQSRSARFRLENEFRQVLAWRSLTSTARSKQSLAPGSEEPPEDT